MDKQWSCFLHTPGYSLFYVSTSPRGLPNTTSLQWTYTYNISYRSVCLQVTSMRMTLAWCYNLNLLDLSVLEKTISSLWVSTKGWVDEATCSLLSVMYGDKLIIWLWSSANTSFHLGVHNDKMTLCISRDDVGLLSCCTYTSELLHT